MSSAPEVPDLLGSDALMQFLKDGLQQLEADQGFADDEARGLLLQLQQQTTLMQTLAGSQHEQQQLTDIQLAEQIDSVDAQLAQLEAALSSADNATKQLLGQGTSKWMNTGSQRDSSKQQHSASSNGHLPAAAHAAAVKQGSPAATDQKVAGDAIAHASQHEQPSSRETQQQAAGPGPATDAEKRGHQQDVPFEAHAAASVAAEPAAEPLAATVKHVASNSIRKHR